MLKQRVGITPAVVGLLVAVLAASWLHDHTNAGQPAIVAQDLRAHDVYRVEAQLTADAPRQDATTVTLRLQRTDTGWQASLTDIKGS